MDGSLACGFRIQRRFRDQYRLQFGFHTQLLVKGVVPNVFHAIPLRCDVIALDWVLHLVLPIYVVVIIYDTVVVVAVTLAVFFGYYYDIVAPYRW